MPITRLYPPFPEELQALGDGMIKRATQALGPHTFEPFALVIQKEGQILGGIRGTQKVDHVSIDELWVHPDHQGKGWGADLLTSLESLAREVGMPRIQLHTYAFFDKDFYLHHDFHIQGQVEDWLAGHTCYFLRKDLKGEPLAESPRELISSIPEAS